MYMKARPIHVHTTCTGQSTICCLFLGHFAFLLQRYLYLSEYHTSSQTLLTFIYLLTLDRTDFP